MLKLLGRIKLSGTLWLILCLACYKDKSPLPVVSCNLREDTIFGNLQETVASRFNPLYGCTFSEPGKV